MKKNLLTACLIFFTLVALAQEPVRINPIVKNFGGIYEIPYAVERPNPSLTYNIVIEVERESESPKEVNWALNNVARLVNLHVMGGVPKENLNVVIAIHGGATYAAMNNEAYRVKYKTDNPNLKLFEELQLAGVKMFICGQSLVNRKVDYQKLVPEVKVSVSMLTVLTTHQLKGYAVLNFK